MARSIKSLFNLKNAAIAGTVAVGTAFGAAFATDQIKITFSNDNEPKSVEENAALYKEILDLIARNSYRNPDITRLNRKNIDEMLKSLDPHSRYIPPEPKKRSASTGGNMGPLPPAGIGIRLHDSSNDSLLIIEETIPFQPAALAGLQPMDIIETINGQSVATLGYVASLKMLRGENFETVDLGITRGQNRFDVKISRRTLPTYPVISATLPGGVAHVTLQNFSKRGVADLLEQEIKRAIRKIGENNFNGLILDLRGNPGGLVSEAVKVADLFLDEGVITKLHDREYATRYYAKEGDVLNGKPLSVLIDRGSASASEMVAGALQDYGRATILGTQSFGKGSGQMTYYLRNGGELRLTESMYFLPSGYSVQRIGVTPDVRFEPHDQPFLSARRVFTTESQRANSLPNPNGPDMPTRQPRETCRPSPSNGTSAPVPSPFYYELDKPDYLLLCAHDRLSAPVTGIRYTLTQPLKSQRRLQPA